MADLRAQVALQVDLVVGLQVDLVVVLQVDLVVALQEASEDQTYY